MRTIHRLRGTRLGAGMALVIVAWPGSAGAIYLDEGRNFSLRARLYNEVSIAAEDSQKQTVTPIRSGDVVSNRTFFNPEFDAVLTPYTSFLHLDEVKFRLALWGFYDGVYDYLPGQWNEARKGLQARITRGRTSSAPEFPRSDHPIDARKVYTYQPDPTLGDDGDPGDVAEVPFRFNEVYADLTKGRVSVRIGRQAISWGESDTIALLDQSNPFDVTRAIPGLFEDIDEARIPLWTVRTQVQLFDSWGPFSSGFLDTYLVPGSIDVTTPIVPIPGAVSPYGTPETDPQSLATNLSSVVPSDVEDLLDATLGGIQVTQYDHQPSRAMANSRYGVRFESVIDREYTASLWFYRTLPQIPVPRFKALDLSHTVIGNPDLPLGSGPTQLITETVHRPTNVFGSSLSFYSGLLNGIVRLNAQFFQDEQAFIPSKNVPFQALLRQPQLRRFLGSVGIDIPKGPDQGFVPTADFLRWEVGYDRFFFNRTLNPSNSFIWVASLVGSWNVSETMTDDDYRYYGQRKTGRGSAPLRPGININQINTLQDIPNLRTVDSDFVDLHEVEWFMQTSLQTEYFHGRLTPRITAIVNPRGTYVINPSVEFRYSDRLLVSVRYAMLTGGFFQTGFFRDRDQVTFRMTFLLN